MLDALVYLVRNVRRDRNPYPANYGVETGFDYFDVLADYELETNSTSKLAEAMNKHYSGHGDLFGQVDEEIIN